MPSSCNCKSTVYHMSCFPAANARCCSLCSWWYSRSLLYQEWPKLSCTMLKLVFQLGVKPRGVCCSSKSSLRNRLFKLRQHILTFQARHDTKKYLQQSCASATDEHQPRVCSLEHHHRSLYLIMADAHIQQLWGPFERRGSLKKRKSKQLTPSQIRQTRLLNSSEH